MSTGNIYQLRVGSHVTWCRKSAHCCSRFYVFTFVHFNCIIEKEVWCVLKVSLCLGISVLFVYGGACDGWAGYTVHGGGHKLPPVWVCRVVWHSLLNIFTSWLTAHQTWKTVVLPFPNITSGSQLSALQDSPPSTLVLNKDNWYKEAFFSPPDKLQLLNFQLFTL